jgi:ABC-type bacteriocin/lantibiotic exporter with double-glycine peptidase domain
MNRIEEVMEVPLVTQGSQLPAPDAPPLLEADQLTFTHPGAEKPTLEEVSLRLEPGSFVGLVGRTGCGKSTLTELLSGWQRADRGEVRWAGVSLETVDSHVFHSELSVVPQDGYLFASTVARNVTLGRPVEPDRLAWALEVAGLTDEVAGFPNGAETSVGEGGVTLSGGQQQRVGLARAVYGRPKALILDGALSNLDARTAQAVVANLHRALPDTSLLVVSHRAVEVEGAQSVSFLEQGRLVAQGPHARLMKSTPAYARLYREESLRRVLQAQTGEREP